MSHASSAAGSEHHREPAAAFAGDERRGGDRRDSDRRDDERCDGERRSGRLLLLRHGETEWSLSGRHTGQTDVALTPRGEQQARDLGELLRGLPVTRVLSSPRQRALRTAELAGLSRIEVDDDLVEWDYGDYEGLTRDQIRDRDPDWTIWTGTVPGGESGQRVRERAVGVLARLGPDLAAGDVLIVGHGHLSRVLATVWLQLPLTAGAVLQMQPACLGVLGDDRGQPVLLRWNLPGRGSCSA